MHGNMLPVQVLDCNAQARYQPAAFGDHRSLPLAEISRLSNVLAAAKTTARKCKRVSTVRGGNMHAARRSLLGQSARLFAIRPLVGRLAAASMSHCDAEALLTAPKRARTTRPSQPGREGSSVYEGSPRVKSPAAVFGFTVFLHFRSCKRSSRWLARFICEGERDALVTTFYPCRRSCRAPDAVCAPSGQDEPDSDEAPHLSGRPCARHGPGNSRAPRPTFNAGTFSVRSVCRPSALHGCADEACALRDQALLEVAPQRDQ
jgi:hypothetical protein